jgi:hypothetical protein
MEMVGKPLPRSNTQLPPSPKISPTPARADNLPVTKDMAIGSESGTVRPTIDGVADDTPAEEASTHSGSGSVKQGHREETGQDDTAGSKQARPQKDSTAAESVPPSIDTDQGHQKDVSPDDGHSVSKPDDDYEFNSFRAGGDYEGLTPEEIEENHLSKKIAKDLEMRAERKEARENAEKEAKDRGPEADALAIAPAAASHAERERVRHEREEEEVERQTKEAAEEARIAAENAEKYQGQKAFIKAVLEGGLPSLRSREAAAVGGAAPALHLHPVRRIVNASSIEFEKKCAPTTVAWRCDVEQQSVTAGTGTCTQQPL